jgi:hypothetical protein
VALYLYALVPPGTKVARLRGLGGERLQALPVEQVIAIAGALETPPAPTLSHLEAQDRLVRALEARTDALLPARFGTHERSAASLIARLEPLAAQLAAALERVRGCAQMTLRVFADGPSAAAASTPADGAGAGTRYLLQLRERRSPALPELASLRQALSPLVREARVTGADQPPLKASVFHLIPRGEVERYRALLAACPPPAGVRWLATGPFPPYAFAPEALS